MVASDGATADLMSGVNLAALRRVAPYQLVVAGDSNSIDDMTVTIPRSSTIFYSFVGNDFVSKAMVESERKEFVYFMNRDVALGMHVSSFTTPTQNSHCPVNPSAYDLATGDECDRGLRCIGGKGNPVLVSDRHKLSQKFRDLLSNNAPMDCTVEVNAADVTIPTVFNTIPYYAEANNLNDTEVAPSNIGGDLPVASIGSHTNIAYSTVVFTMGTNSTASPESRVGICHFSSLLEMVSCGLNVTVTFGFWIETTSSEPINYWGNGCNTDSYPTVMCSSTCGNLVESLTSKLAPNYFVSLNSKEGLASGERFGSVMRSTPLTDCPQARVSSLRMPVPVNGKL